MLTSEQFEFIEAKIELNGDKLKGIVDVSTNSKIRVNQIFFKHKFIN